jgi:hypothetical protein
VARAHARRGAPSHFADRRFCEQQHLDEILRVADNLRKVGHPIADTDDPHKLCQDIAHALWSPYVGGKQKASYPVTKTLLTALMLFGFSSPAEALKSGQQVCAPTVCMLNGGKDQVHLHEGVRGAQPPGQGWGPADQPVFQRLRKGKVNVKSFTSFVV